MIHGITQPKWYSFAAVGILLGTFIVIAYPIIINVNDVIVGGEWFLHVPSWITIPVGNPWIINVVALAVLGTVLLLYWHAFHLVLRSTLFASLATMLLFLHPWFTAQFGTINALLLFALVPLTVISILHYHEKGVLSWLVFACVLFIAGSLIRLDWSLVLLFAHLGMWIWFERNNLRNGSFPSRSSRSGKWFIAICASLLIICAFQPIFGPDRVLKEKKQFELVKTQSVQLDSLVTPYHYFPDLGYPALPYIGFVLIAALLFFGLHYKKMRWVSFTSGAGIVALLLSLGPVIQTAATNDDLIPLPYLFLFRHAPFHRQLADPQLFFIIALLCFIGTLCALLQHSIMVRRSNHNHKMAQLIAIVITFVIAFEFFSAPYVPYSSTSTIHLLNTLHEASEKQPGMILNFQDDIGVKPAEQYFIKELTNITIHNTIDLPAESTMHHLFDASLPGSIFPETDKISNTALAEKNDIGYFILHKKIADFDQTQKRLLSLFRLEPVYSDDTYIAYRLNTDGVTENNTKYIRLNSRWSDTRVTRGKEVPFRFSRPSEEGTDALMYFHGYNAASPRSIVLRVSGENGQVVRFFMEGGENVDVRFNKESVIDVTIPWNNSSILHISSDKKMKVYDVSTQ